MKENMANLPLGACRWYGVALRGGFRGSLLGWFSTPPRSAERSITRRTPGLQFAGPLIFSISHDDVYVLDGESPSFSAGSQRH